MDNCFDDFIGECEMSDSKMMLELARSYFNHIVEADNLSFAKHMASIGSSEIGDWLRKNVESGAEQSNETQNKPVVRWKWAYNVEGDRGVWREYALFLSEEEVKEYFKEVLHMKLEYTRTEFPE